MINVKFYEECESGLRIGLACKEKSENCQKLSKHEVEFIWKKVEKVAHTKFPAVLYIALKKIQEKIQK